MAVDEKTLYLQCDSGVSGDMLVGALLDLGADEAHMRHALAEVERLGVEVFVSRRLVRGLDACDLDVRLPQGFQNHDHDMAWLYSDGSQTTVGTNHDNLNENASRVDTDADEQRRAHGSHAHTHRTLAQVLEIVDRSALGNRAYQIARHAFELLAQAEGKAHGVAADKVLLHEVGALDSIADVIAVAACLEDLAPDHVVVGPLTEGSGQVRTEHGLMPVPVPAVVNLLAQSRLVLHLSDRQEELITPTGAALCAAMADGSQLPASAHVLGVGIGAGKRAYDPPSLVRAFLLQEVEEKGTQTPSSFSQIPVGDDVVWKLETDIDDTSAEVLGMVISQLMEAGAREAHTLALTMKQGRPGTQIQVLCDEADIDRLEEILFSQTTTIGIRRTPMQRTVLPRTAVSIDTDLGKAKAKAVTLPDGTRRTYPEHREIVRLAKEAAVSYQEALRAVQAALWEHDVAANMKTGHDNYMHNFAQS